MTTQPALPAKLSARLRALPDWRREPIVALVELAVSTAERQLAHPRKVDRRHELQYEARMNLLKEFGPGAKHPGHLDRATFPDE